jgi:site-specific DNA-methyltransferase (cytosine-N4-specific)
MNIQDKLKKIDWNFNDSKTNCGTHDFHSYPAKFIPQIPRKLIELFSKENETVYDPFCGSGTTIVEAILCNRQAIGNDVNPLAILISKVKSTHIKENQSNRIKHLLSRIEETINNLYKDPAAFKIQHAHKTHIIKSPNLEYWFHEDVVSELGIIKKAISNEKDKDIKDFLSVAFSNIIVSVSFQDSSTRYVKVEKNIQKKDAFLKFKACVLRMIKKNNELSGVSSNRPIVRITDTREHTGFKEDVADIAITSPPYPNAYDYHLYHKHRMYWLEMDPLELKHREIGAHAHYSKQNGFTESNFAEDMIRSFREVSRILKANKYFFVVIGDSIIKGRKIKNNELLKNMSRNTKFSFQGEVRRNIKLSRKSFNPLIGKIKTEHIMFFKNQK